MKFQSASASFLSHKALQCSCTYLCDHSLSLYLFSFSLVEYVKQTYCELICDKSSMLCYSGKTKKMPKDKYLSRASPHSFCELLGHAEEEEGKVGDEPNFSFSTRPWLTLHMWTDTDL